MKPKLILTADPSFTDMAIAELKKVQPEAEIVAELADGVFAVTFADDFFCTCRVVAQISPYIYSSYLSCVDGCRAG